MNICRPTGKSRLCGNLHLRGADSQLLPVGPQLVAQLLC